MWNKIKNNLISQSCTNKNETEQLWSTIFKFKKYMQFTHRVSVSVKAHNLK